MATNFANLLNTKVDDVKRPEILPQGTYFGTIARFEPVESGQKKTPGIRFSGKYSHPGDDVDTNELAEKEIELSKRNWNYTFWLGEDNAQLWRVAEFLEALGIDASGMSLGAALPQTQGKMVQISVVQQPREVEGQVEPEIIAQVNRIAPAA